MPRRKAILYWGVAALLLAGWLYIAWNVPYTHDDWDWGLPEGLERWLSGTLNNRYAGTFFVLAMTRSQLVKTAVMGGCMFLISLLLGRLAGRGQPDRAFSVTVLTAALLFTTPMDSWQQSLGWGVRLCQFCGGGRVPAAGAAAVAAGLLYEMHQGSGEKAGSSPLFPVSAHPALCGKSDLHSPVRRPGVRGLGPVE